MKQWIPKVALLVCVVILLRLLTFSMTFDSHFEHSHLLSQAPSYLEKPSVEARSFINSDQHRGTPTPVGHKSTPSPATPVVGEKLGDHHGSCFRLPLNKTAAMWVTSVELCGFSESECRGASLQIFLANGCEETRRAVSRNTQINKLILQQHGPDSFRLRVDGPEVFSRSAQYLGECRYLIQLPPLRHRGQYRLDLERLYKDYHAMDEITNQWPRLLKQPLLPSFIPETHYHLQQMTLPSTCHIECKGTFLASPRLPRCTGYEEDLSGRWVKEGETSGQKVHTRVRVKKVQRNPIKFQWAIEPDTPARWHPHHCSPSPQSSGDELGLIDVKATLKGKKIVVGGDSQSRALYYSILNTLNGNGVSCVRNITTLDGEPSQCIPNVKGSQRKQIGGLAQVDFVDDHFLDKLASGRYNGYDYVIVGFAQHPASKEHWSFDKYKNAVNARMKTLQKTKSQGSKIIWILAPQYPHSSHGYPVVVKDWRTDDRLKLFNNYSEGEARRVGIPILDQFSISSPMAHTSPDQAHFTNWVAYEFVRMLFSIITTSN